MRLVVRGPRGDMYIQGPALEVSGRGADHCQVPRLELDKKPLQDPLALGPLWRSRSWARGCSLDVEVAKGPNGSALHAALHVGMVVKNRLQEPLQRAGGASANPGGIDRLHHQVVKLQGQEPISRLRRRGDNLSQRLDAIMNQEPDSLACVEGVAMPGVRGAVLDVRKEVADWEA